MNLPYFKLYVSRWLLSESISTMSLIEEGAYFRLLCFSWINHGSIPDDNEWLALHSKLTINEWLKIESKVRKRFTSKKGRLIPKILDAIFKEAEELSKTNSKTATIRWSREKYFESELTSFKVLSADSTWLESQQKFHPDLNIPLSIEKAHTQFWSTEEGYEYFKSKNSKPKNWKKTFQNALSIATNQVKRSTQNGGTEKTGLQRGNRKNIGKPGYDATGIAIGAQAGPGEFDEGTRTLADVRNL